MPQSLLTDAELREKLDQSPAQRVTEERLNTIIEEVTYYRHGLLTFCVLDLANGFIVTGESACASADNYDEEIGRKIAYDNARKQLWVLEGYLLRQQLSETVQ